LCKNIHGHSYSLHVCIGGIPSVSIGVANEGMVLDFSDLKKIVQEHVLDDFDHALIINGNSNGNMAEKFKDLNVKIIKLPFEPTSENLIVYIAEKLTPVLPSHVQLISLRLYETASSYVDWMQTDN
jgi:6-pyruvoyltetrahydropterin/6-carboxytetrahydropterin synthase